MTTIALNQAWAAGWTRNLSGDGAIAVDGDGVMQISATSGVALIKTPFTASGGFLIKARMFGFALSGAVRAFVAYDAAAASIMTDEAITDGDLQMRELVSALAHSYGDTTLYLGVGIRAGETGSGKFFAPRLNLD